MTRFYENGSSDDDEPYSLVNNRVSLHMKPHRDMQNRCFGGRLWCIKDICGMICAIFTWMLILYAQFVVVFVVLLPDARVYPLYVYANMILFQFLSFMAFTSHLRTMLTDPGAVPKGTATDKMIQKMSFPEGQIIYKCSKCYCIKPERAHHCSVCQRCIRKMDHHCPWVNNCVGENNQKYFVLFTFYIALLSNHALVLAFLKFIYCVKSEWQECSDFSPPATVVLVLFLIAEALLFGIFTIIMLGTQLHSIWHDETGIEQLKKEQASWIRKSRWKSLQSVFGRFSIFWFTPFSPPSLRSRSDNMCKSNCV